MEKPTTAKIFMHGRSQAVRLPKEFRMEGTEVSVTRNGDAVTLTPIKRKKTDWAVVFAEIDAMGSVEDYPEGWRNQPILPLPTEYNED
jgi:antitoxin VapB